MFENFERNPVQVWTRWAQHPKAEAHKSQRILLEILAGACPEMRATGLRSSHSASLFVSILTNLALPRRYFWPFGVAIFKIAIFRSRVAILRRY